MSKFSVSPQNSEAKLRTQVATARYDLLAVVILTALNVLLLLGNTGTYFVFSASVPYAIMDIGMLVCGLYPAELYEGELAEMILLDGGAIGVFAALALAGVAVYLLLFFLSKKHTAAALTVSSVLFGLDTLFMFVWFGIELSMLLDLFFHGWILFTLIRGITAARKLKELPPEEAPTFPAGTPEEGEFPVYTQEPDSLPLRVADMAEKQRVLLEATVLGHHILYRRVKKTNELVIDGRVYDEYVAIFERAHLLNATLGGHVFSAGFDGTGNSMILVDGNVCETKRRVF